MIRRLVAACAWLATLHAAPLQAQPLTSDQFSARIEALAAAVRAADVPAAVRLAAAVPATERVSAAGTTYDVPLGWLRRGLEAAASARSWPEQRERLAERLEVLSSEAVRLGEGRGRDDAPRRALTGVLADRRFAGIRSASWQAMLRDRLRQWLIDLFARAASRGWSSRLIMQVIAWTLSIAAVIVLVVWLLRVALPRRAERPVGVGPVGAFVPPGHVLGAEAAELIRTGRVREGARAAYRAVLRRLDEEGVLPLDAAKTPRETLRLVAPSHRRAAPLAAITAVFERIWYGSRPAGEAEGTRLLGLLREFECLPSDRVK